VVTPPSHVNGRHYELIKRTDERGGLNWDAVARLLEPELQQRPRRSDERSTDARRLSEWMAHQQEGNRNDGLFWAANRALDAGLTELEELADAARRTGLDEREIARTVASAHRRADRPFGAEPLTRGTPEPVSRQREAEGP
jgi:hypothetical protein